MVILQLIGGLGNQMFQYAFAKRIAIERDQTLYLDLSFYNKQFNPMVDNREFTLGKLDINPKILSGWFSFFFNPSPTSTRYRKILSAGLRKVSSTAIICENVFNNVQDIVDLPVKNILLKGYWQGEKFFSPIAQKIREEFYLIEKCQSIDFHFVNSLRSQNSVGIHIRRGDYLRNPFHGVLPLEYYEVAMDYFRARISQPVFYCFTDDPEWVRDTFPLSSHFILCSDNYSKSDFHDLQLMATCRHQIIANSTFSWWAAWLNANPDKIVIAPNRWFSQSENSFSTGCMVPSSWLRF